MTFLIDHKLAKQHLLSIYHIRSDKSSFLKTFSALPTRKRIYAPSHSCEAITPVAASFIIAVRSLHPLQTLKLFLFPKQLPSHTRSFYSSPQADLFYFQTRLKAAANHFPSYIRLQGGSIPYLRNPPSALRASCSRTLRHQAALLQLLLFTAVRHFQHIAPDPT